MTFFELLNEYIAQIGCTAKDLAAASGVSEAQLSRWRGGERKPSPEQAGRLAAGIAALGGAQDVEAVRSALSAALAEGATDYDRVLGNCNALIDALNIRQSELSRALNYDASYLSRIRTGQRKPADLAMFVEGVCRFAVRKNTSADAISAIGVLTGAEAELPEDPEACFRVLTEWVYGGTLKTTDTTGSFLKKLEEIDLNEYIRSIRFDELKVPTAPFQLPVSRSYTGLREMMEAELSFLRATVTSRSEGPVLIYSDMPMGKMAADPEFPKKWMFGMAAMLKKGLRLNMIHNVDRPLRELLLGLEAYIPMYMTGQISPYYLKSRNSAVFHHLLEVSGSAALSGEAIVGHHEEGRYYLTKNREELRYYQKRADALLHSASPLMDIYRADSKQRFHLFLQQDFSTVGTRRLICSAMPLFTISDALLERVLSHNQVSDTDAEKIRNYVTFQRSLYASLPEGSRLSIEVPCLSREEYRSRPLALALAGLFYESDVFYTFDEYQEHLRATLEAENGETITVKLRESPPFQNIEILVHSGSWAMVSKNRAPAIHFVLRHPKLVDAIERFTPPVVE